jgi:5-methylcytosine-specific restriction endonuclease McrA
LVSDVDWKAQLPDTIARMSEAIPIEPKRTPADIISSAIAAILDGQRDAATGAIEELRCPLWTPPARKEAPMSMYVAVFRRDHFHCRYCDRRTLFHPLFELLSVGFFPEVLPFHPNWRAGHVHPAVVTWSTSLDHVLPVVAGGHHADPRNLATACAQCQYAKGNSTRGWPLKPITTQAWDGLSGYYQRLWAVAQYQTPGLALRPGHQNWLTALRRSSPAIDDALPEGFRSNSRKPM